MFKRVLTFAAAALALAALPMQAAAHDEPVAGSLIGAGIGAAIGGPPGAAVGAIVGAAIGSHVAHETDHPHAHPGPVARREKVRYVERVRYVEQPPRYVGCEAAPARAYHPRIIHRDERVKVAARPATKRVCRDVPVRERHAAWIPARP